MNFRPLLLLFVAAYCSSCGDRDGPLIPPAISASSTPAQGSRAQVTNPEETARHWVMAALQGTMRQFSVKGDAALYAEDGGFFYRFHFEPAAAALDVMTLPVSDEEKEGGILGRFIVDVTAGLTLEGKVFNLPPGSRHSDGSASYVIPDKDLPFLSPWSPRLKFSEVFAPYLVEVLRDMDVRARKPLEGLKPLADQDVVKLLNQDQMPLLNPHAQRALKSVQDAFVGAHAIADDSIFVFRTMSLMGRLPSAQTAHFAPTLDAALRWNDIYAQNTLLTVREVVGPRQFWAVEEAVNQVDQINGIVARGVIYAAAIGFTRAAEVTVQTEYLHQEQVRLKLLTPWSGWQPPDGVFYTVPYSVNSSGTLEWGSHPPGGRDPSPKGLAAFLPPVKDGDARRVIQLTNHTKAQLPEPDASDVKQALQEKGRRSRQGMPNR